MENKVEENMEDKTAPVSNGAKIPIEVSARHIHISKVHLEELFGKGKKLTKFYDLSQPGQFAANETLTVVGNRNEFKKVRILGPVRDETQVELSFTDVRYLGLVAPLRLSGKLGDSGECSLVGPAGRIVNLKDGVIVAKRHLHAALYEAKSLKIKDGEVVKIEVSGERAVVFENVICRVGPEHKLALHIDTDEGNAAGIQGRGEGQLI